MKCSLFLFRVRKNFGASTLHDITDQHIEFLIDLSNKTQRPCQFIETDYCKSLCEFKDNYHKIPYPYDKDFIENVIQLIEVRMTGVNEYSFYHGDFTPWNTYLTEKIHWKYLILNMRVILIRNCWMFFTFLRKQGYMRVMRMQMRF